MSQQLGSIIQDQDYSYRVKTVKPTIAIDKINIKDADGIIASVTDLITDPDYRPFFYSRLYALGKGRFLEMAEKARKYGKNPQQYFVHLIGK